MTRWPRPGMSPPGELVPQALQAWYDGSEEAFRDAVCAQAKKYLAPSTAGAASRAVALIVPACQQRLYAVRRAHLPGCQDRGGLAHAPDPLCRQKAGRCPLFPRHIALYLGEGRYIHSTGASASGGVVINSLDPATRCTGKIWSRVCMRWGVCSDKVTHPLRHPCGMPPLPKGEALAIPPQGFGKPPEAPPLGELAKPSGFD